MLINVKLIKLLCSKRFSPILRSVREAFPQGRPHLKPLIVYAALLSLTGGNLRLLG